MLRVKDGQENGAETAIRCTDPLSPGITDIDVAAAATAVRAKELGVVQRTAAPR